MIARAVGAGAISLTLASCGPPPAAALTDAPPIVAASAAVDPATVVDYACTDTTGKDVSSATTRGRVTLYAFAATYDDASLIETHYLGDLAHRHSPRMNVVMLVLEREENRPLVEAFATDLKLPFSVCLADTQTIAGAGQFAGMNSVPSVLVVDKSGHERSRHLGVLTEEELDKAVTEAEAH